MNFLALLTQSWKFLMDLWDTGSWWARMITIALIAYPVVLILFSFAGVTYMLAVVGVALFVILLILAIARVNPLVPIILSSFGSGRAVLRIVGYILGMGVSTGVLLSFIHLSTNRPLSAILLLAVIAASLLSLSLPGFSIEKTAKRMRGIMVAIGFIAAAFLCLLSLPGMLELISPGLRPALEVRGKHELGKIERWIADTSIAPPPFHSESYQKPAERQPTTFSGNVSFPSNANAMIPSGTTIPPSTLGRVDTFKLLVGVRTPTFSAGHGTIHWIYTNKPFIAFSRQPDGSEKLFRSNEIGGIWAGANPAGVVYCEALDLGTVLIVVRKQ